MAHRYDRRFHQMLFAVRGPTTDRAVSGLAHPQYGAAAGGKPRHLAVLQDRSRHVQLPFRSFQALVSGVAGGEACEGRVEGFGERFFGDYGAEAGCCAGESGEARG